MMHRNATNAAQPRSLVDTLGAGFRALNRALPALLIPLALDIWYWIGPRISLRPLGERLRSLDPRAWDQARQQLRSAMPLDRPFDLRLDGQFPFWRRIYTLVPATTAPQPIEPMTWHIGGFLALLAALIAINALLAFLTALYLLPLADVVRGSASPGTWLRRVGRTWLSLLGLMGLMMIVLIVIGLPLLAVAGVLVSVAPLVGAIIMSFFVAAVLWLVFSASFAYDAVVVSGAGPIRAMFISLLLIRTSFWKAVGLFLLSYFILAGLEIIWEGLARSLPGLIVAMVTSAYVGAGLAAAHLVFYRDRVPQLEAGREA